MSTLATHLPPYGGLRAHRRAKQHAGTHARISCAAPARAAMVIIVARFFVGQRSAPRAPSAAAAAGAQHDWQQRARLRPVQPRCARRRSAKQGHAADADACDVRAAPVAQPERVNHAVRCERGMHAANALLGALHAIQAVVVNASGVAIERNGVRAA